MNLIIVFSTILWKEDIFGLTLGNFIGKKIVLTYSMP